MPDLALYMMAQLLQWLSGLTSSDTTSSSTSAVLEDESDSSEDSIDESDDPSVDLSKTERVKLEQRRLKKNKHYDVVIFMNSLEQVVHQVKHEEFDEKHTFATFVDALDNEQCNTEQIFEQDDCEFNTGDQKMQCKTNDHATGFWRITSKKPLDEVGKARKQLILTK